MNIKKNTTKQHMLFIIAAALAAAGLDPAGSTEMLEGGEVELPAVFGRNASLTQDGALRTSKNYGVRIDRLSLNPSVVELSTRRDVFDAAPRRVVQLGEVVSAAGQLERRPVFGEVEEPGPLELKLSGVQVEARVFDLANGNRLPSEGVKVTGTLPVDVTVRKERRLDLWVPGKMETVLAVDFELPSAFFDDVDWQMLA